MKPHTTAWPLTIIAMMLSALAGGCERGDAAAESTAQQDRSIREGVLVGAPAAQPSQEIKQVASSASTSQSSSPQASSDGHAQGGHGAKGGKANRLVNETSPYLLQHAYNPVDWYPWGPEAFEAARAQDKPIFLSVGYSTCYWCHVMERESFESEAIAALMNEHFICIKVDREERPDVDDIYMTAVQILTKSGGWPMSVFLEPQTLKPFLGGTYFPPQDQYGRPGFPSLLQQVSTYWTQQRDQVIAQANHVADAISQHQTVTSAPRPLGPQNVDRAVTSLMGSYDANDAGFGGAPKFPMPANLDLLIGAAWDQENVRAAIVHTLDRMATGGMYDQVGGGFHRYSTDGRWLVPHFEKMLYDNGQLATTYAEAYERTGDAFYAEILREICDYVLREMTEPGGGFFSAQDAEVNAREGQNYVWTAQQVTEVLTAADQKADVEFALKIYGLDSGTNFQDPHHREDPPTNVLFLVNRPDVLAKELGLELDAFNAQVRRINTALLAVRDQRDQPSLDDKVLAGWNGLMIAGMADAGRVLGEERYLRAAARSAAFVLDSMRGDDGGLRRSYRGGDARIDAFCEDYAFMIHGLLALHRASGDASDLEHATELARAARTRFWDESFGGYFDTLAEQSDLFVRTKSTYDGAVACANSVMLNNLLSLYERTGAEMYLDDATATLRALSAVVVNQPRAAILSTLALHRFTERHPDRLDWSDDATSASAQPVRVETSIESVELAAGETGTFMLMLHITDGYHINAREPGLDFLIPLAVEVHGDADVKLSVDYPAGETFSGPAQGMLVHHGTVEIPIRLERTGDIRRAPHLTVTYQVCTDKACLAPETVPLPVRISAE